MLTHPFTKLQKKLDPNLLETWRQYSAMDLYYTSSILTLDTIMACQKAFDTAYGAVMNGSQHTLKEKENSKPLIPAHTKNHSQKVNACIPSWMRMTAHDPDCPRSKNPEKTRVPRTLRTEIKWLCGPLRKKEVKHPQIRGKSYTRCHQ